jgi:hypothetical protein
MAPAIAIPQGLETIAEGTNPVVEYVRFAAAITFVRLD